MDIFVKATGIYIPLNFAARVLLAIGKARKSAKPENLRLWNEEEPRDVWVLAMVLVQWYADQLPSDEAAATTSAFAETGVGTLASTLSLFRDRLTPFARASHAAKGDADLDGAAVYFNAALDQIGLGNISAAIKSGPVQDVGAKLLEKYPLPPELATAYLGRPVVKKPTRETLPTIPNRPPAPGTPTPSAPGIPSKPSRSDRFDRADRDRPLPKVPALVAEERLTALLYVRGWSPEQIDQIKRGPKGKA